MPVSKTKNQKPKTKTVKTVRTITKKSETKVKQGLSLPVFGLKGEKKGTVELPKEIFGAKVNKVLMAQAVRVHLANQMQGTGSSKTRGQVSGSTRKIYRQKGTGRARHGSIKAPIFVGGGITFGPSPRDVSLKLSKQMKKKALFSALTSKLSDQKVLVVDANSVSGKTKEIFGMLKALNLTEKDRAQKVLLVSDSDQVVRRAARNIENVTVEPAKIINTFDVLSNKYLVFAKNAISELENNLLKKE